MSAIGKNIRALRERLGLTQEELAIKTGYSDRTSIAKIESGKINIPQSKIEIFAKALKTTPIKLMGWKDDSDIAIGKRLSALREQKNLSIEELSQKANVNLDYIKKIEMGTGDTSSYEMGDLASALCVDYEYLMGWVSLEDSLLQEALSKTNIVNAVENNLEYLGDETLNRLYSIYVKLSSTGKKKLLDFAEDLAKIYAK